MLFFKKKPTPTLAPSFAQLSLCPAYHNGEINVSPWCDLILPDRYRTGLKVVRIRPAPVVTEKKPIEPAPKVVRNGPISSDSSGIISVLGLKASN